MLAPLLQWLGRAGPSRAHDIAGGLGVSRSAVQRALGPLPVELLRVGKARATRYAARRHIDGVDCPVPVHEVGADGQLRQALTLHPVEPFGYYVEGHVPEVSSGFVETDPRDPGPDPYSDLPWFLLDAKPSGFLGRAWVRAHNAEGYPGRLERWSGDHVLRYATRYGTDLLGAFVLGEFTAAAVHRRPEPEVVVSEHQVETAFPTLVERMLTEQPWGSSPGGEQPKFPVVVESTEGRTALLVKFTAPLSTESGERWADLLVCEHIVHDVLRRHGIPSATSRTLDAGGRRFLLVERFDRTPSGGRVGQVSLAALDRAGIAHEMRRWSLGSGPLVRAGLLDESIQADIRWLERFGHWIANTDMHPGNLSFTMRGTQLTGLTPVYDMLPMFHAPRGSGDVMDLVFDPRTEDDGSDRTVLTAAAEFWDLAAHDSRISPRFRELARRARERLGT